VTATAAVLASNVERWFWWDWVSRNTDLIRHDLIVHLELTVAAVLLGLTVALPLGVLSQRRRRWYGPVIGVTGILYTIPSLAAFAMLIPFTGLSTWTALIPLTSYTLLILVRNVVAGLDGVPAEVRESADAMGYTRGRRLLRVELPLALPAIMAGIRIATVTTVGLLTVAAIVGLGGLGHLILVGLQRPIRTAVTVGAVLSIVVAVVADLALAGLQRGLSPWARKRAVA
jgi:osmoprotectant transport system permease protein